MRPSLSAKTELKMLTALEATESLHSLERNHLKKLASIANLMEFPEDKIIYQAGDIGRAIYLIQEGEVAIEIDLPDSSQVTVLTLKPGQLFGWSSLFPERRKMTRARVIKPTQAVVIQAKALHDLFQKDPDLEKRIMKCIAVVKDHQFSQLQLAKKLSSNSR